MNPSIDDRLDSVMRALQEVVLPALAPERSLAIEQVHLSLAHLGLVREQLDRAPAFERAEADGMLALAAALAKDAGGGPVTMAAAESLRVAASTAVLDNPADTRRATIDVGNAIETLIGASLQDGTAAFRTASAAHVLAAGKHAALADRRWNRNAGFEAPDTDLADAPAA